MRRLIFLVVFCAVALPDVLDAQINWARHPGNPVLGASSGNPYDPLRIEWAFQGSFMYDDARAAYMTWLPLLVTGIPQFEGVSLSCATSFDGANWFYYSKNPVITPTPGAFDARVVGPAKVLKDAGGYKMYYSGETQGWMNKIGLATSSNGLQWQKYASNPILSPGPSGSWDSQNIYGVDVLLVGQTYYMWYAGSGPDLVHRIGLATSTDGVVWTKHPANPVLNLGSPGRWDAASIVLPRVVVVNGVFYMLYTGTNTMFANEKIGLATSSDGIVWQRYPNNPVMSGQGGWEGSRISSASVLFRNNKFHLWYDGNNGRSQTGYATANLEYNPNPPQPNIVSNGGFETGTSPWIFYSNGSATFSRVSPGSQSSYAARVSVTTQGTNVQLSQTGITLRPNTLYRLSFDAYSNTGHDLSVFLHRNTSPYTNYGINNFVCNLTTTWQQFSLVFTTAGFSAQTTDSRLRFWFSPYDAPGDQFFVDNVTIALVGGEEPNDGSLEVSSTADVPESIYLTQNYPNPFNPETSIRFGLPQDGHVSLKVYDTLGREIATLVDEARSAGDHSVSWDAVRVPSGVYFCRLQTETGHSEVLKMTLLK